MADDDAWVQVEAPGEITDEINAAGSSNCGAVQQSPEVVEANSDEVPIVDKLPNAEETTPVTQSSKTPMPQGFCHRVVATVKSCVGYG